MNVVAEQATREQDRDERNIYEVDINQYLTFLRLRAANHRAVAGWAGACPVSLCLSQSILVLDNS